MPTWVQVLLALLANPQISALLQAVIDAIIKAIAGGTTPQKALEAQSGNLLRVYAKLTPQHQEFIAKELEGYFKA